MTDFPCDPVVNHPPARGIPRTQQSNQVSRALKTRGNTPKYRLIFHSTFTGRAAAKNKGRISRYLANKCSTASRTECFSEVPTSAFLEKAMAPTPAFLPAESHGRRSLVGYSPWGRKESDTTERLDLTDQCFEGEASRTS